MKKIISAVLIIAVMLSVSLATFSSANTSSEVPHDCEDGLHGFSDVPQDAVYCKAIAELSHICELGYGDGTFRPDETMTRAEFAALIIKILKPSALDGAKRDQIFTDVPATHWANQYITIAFDERLINGCGNGMFKPEGNIKYEEMIKIVVSYILGGELRGASYPDGYIDIAEELGINDIQSGIGQDSKRWQVAMLIYNAINADEAMVEAVAEKNAGLKVTASGGGAGGGSAKVFGVAESAPMAPGASVMTESTSADVSGGYSGGAYSEGEAADAPPMPIIAPEPERQVIAGLLTAGEWNDNDNWEFWNKLMANREWYTLQSKWKISMNRYVAAVSDGDIPVIGATVALMRSGDVVWEAVTDNRGYAVIFADMASDDAANQQGNEFVLEVTTSADSTVIDGVMLTDDRPYAVNIGRGNVTDSIDVMFMIDTTGSMGDELQYIKEELSDVIERITCDVRVSCNFYRDLGDEYIVRPFPFTTDVDEAVTQISGQRAAGGGDYPEAVELALANAIYEHEWNPDAKERFLFLVLDAPPHYTDEIAAKIGECIKAAAAKGIRIIPVASSGVDKDTEFLLRSMSIATNGTYVFLTDHSGIGNSHIEPTIGKYDVELLNDLLVKVINNRL